MTQQPDDLDRIVERMLDGHEHSRRQFVRVLAATGLSVSSAGFLAACGGVGGGGGGKRASTKVNHPKVAIGNWTFSNWPLYIDKSVLKDFDRKFGGHVNYVEEINDNYEFFGKVRQQLVSGRPIGRDIVVLTDYMAPRWVDNGWVTAIDQRNVPNMKNLVDNQKDVSWDPHRNFSLPWQSGAVGIGYDPRRTGRKITSIKDLFDPKFKGRVGLFQEPFDTGGLVMLMDGVNPTTAKVGDILKALDKVDAAQKSGQIRRFTGNDYSTDLTKGNFYLCMAYSGDLVQLQADNPHLEFVYPEEGAMLFTDNMMMPEKAAHPYAAETMMNYVYDPQVAAKIAKYVNYISPVKGVKDILLKSDPQIAANPLIFPPADVVKRLHHYPVLTAAEDRQIHERMAEVMGA